MSVTFRQLEVFVAVATEGSVSAAARALGLSQSAASTALAELERLLGERFFDRPGRGLRLNERGRALLPRAADVLARVAELDDLFGAGGGRLAGDLRVGASSTIGNYLVPRLLGGFARAAPDVRLHLEVGNTEQIVAALANFDIDVGFIEGFCHAPELDVHPWRRDELTVFAAPDHPLARAGAPTPADLAAADWILRERGSGTREVFEAAVAGRVGPLRVFLELGHTEAIKQAVEAGLGVSCLSRLTVARALRDGTLVPLATPYLDLGRWFFRLLHRDKHRTAVLERFLAFCEADPARA